LINTPREGPAKAKFTRTAGSAKILICFNLATFRKIWPHIDGGFECCALNSQNTRQCHSFLIPLDDE